MSEPQLLYLVEGLDWEETWFCGVFSTLRPAIRAGRDAPPGSRSAIVWRVLVDGGDDRDIIWDADARWKRRLAKRRRVRLAKATP